MVILYIFLWILILVIIFLWYYLLSQFKSLVKTWVPYVQTFDEEIELLENGLNLCKWRTLLDLGCGDGKVLRSLVKCFDLFSGVWYDINWFSIIKGRIINYFYDIKNIELYKKDFRKIDISKFDYIYVYLFVDKYEDRLMDHIWENAVLINNSFPFKKHKPYMILKSKNWKPKIYLYKK